MVVSFQVVELELDAQGNVLNRKVVPYPIKTCKTPRRRPKVLPRVIPRRATTRRLMAGAQLTAAGSRSASP
jgi:hypothetical protein